MNKPVEIWKPVPGQENFYEVSSQGNFRSLDRTVLTNRGLVSYKGKPLKTIKCTNKYLAIQLGRNKRLLAHRVVAAAFLGPQVDMQVNHKNGKRDDNRVENLEWVTCSENHRHSHRELNRKQHAKTQAVVIGETFYASVLAAAKKLGISPGSVSSAAIRAHRCKGMEVKYV